MGGTLETKKENTERNAVTAPDSMDGTVNRLPAELTEIPEKYYSSASKNILDHGIQDGLIRPIIVVCPTYNNESESDSGDYSLALRLTENYHNELVNDLIPAVEGKCGSSGGGDEVAYGGWPDYGMELVPDICSDIGKST